MTNQRP
ncbi:unnamed protein product [Rhodiola kirilowii]